MIKPTPAFPIFRPKAACQESTQKRSRRDAANDVRYQAVACDAGMAEMLALSAIEL